MASSPRVGCREIEPADLQGIIDLLTEGFKRDRNRAYWARAIKMLSEHSAPAGLPKYGYLLESAGVPVGVLLLIFSTRPADPGPEVRCNVSSWYVMPSFRGYAALLASRATRRKDVVYLNITASPHTWPILETQGYRPFSEGIYIVAPALFRSSPKLRIDLANPEVCREAGLPQFEADLLLAHATYGCLSVIGYSDGRHYPFVFGLRTKRMVPLAHLIYCRDRADFVEFAGPLARFMTRRGFPLVVLDSNGPVRGVTGKYIGNRPKFAKTHLSTASLRIGDLAYTERVMFGF